MESNDFFKNDIGNKFKNKTGIYIFKSPLKYNGQDIFKVGYAYQSLYKRLRDFKTAFGPIPFYIYVVYEIPERIFNAPRVMWALGSEKQMHQTLKEVAVMKDDEGRLEGEWFYSITDIMNAFNLLRQDHLNKIQGADKWDLYLYGGGNRVITRSQASKIKLVDMNEINSSFKDLLPKPRTTRNRPNNKYGEEYETDHNPSRNFIKDKYIYKNI